jgi:O-acetyl-ADP-ribose deacetylase (regulator of RNase III)
MDSPKIGGGARRQDLGGPWRVDKGPSPRSGAQGATAGAGLEVALFPGEIAAAPAEAICVSTNPRLSLEGGTGRAVLAAAGWAIKRQAEALVAAGSPPGGPVGLPVGFAGTTTAGHLPYRLVIHCVASDSRHRSSPAAVRRCVREALAAAQAADCTRVAMPVFASGHAGLRFEAALVALVEALREAATSVTTVVIAVPREDRARAAARVLDRLLG